ncbi:MAG: hypothetical protein IJL87_06030, partial [Clostridia bacterium]|nr:hypothetical protein [Clostridia bacterium]
MRAVLTAGHESSALVKMTVADALSGYFDALSDLYMPVLRYEGEEPKAEGTAVFRKDKLMGILDTEETCSLLLMQKKGCRFFMLAGDACCNITLSKLKKKIVSKEDGRPCVRFKITVYAVNTQA